MQIEASVSCLLTSVRVVPSKRQETPNASKHVQKRELWALLVGMQSAQKLWKVIMAFLKKLNIELPCDPAVLLPVIYLKKMKTLTREFLHPHV